MQAGDVARILEIDESDVRNAVFYWTEETGVYEELAENANLGPGAEIFADNEEAPDESLDDIADRTLEEGEDDVEYVEYSGPVGELQNIIEGQADKRGFKIRYNPDEWHRSVLEMHVVKDSESDDEAYLGANGQVFYIGSTVSKGDKEFTDPEEAKHVIKQELNSLLYSRD